MKTFFKVPTIMIHDPSLKIVGVIDNNKPKSLHFFDDEWERDLATGASVFSFSVYKKFTSDNELQRDPSSLLRKRNFISFNYKGETFLFLIYKIKETRTMLELECRNLNLELINESALPFKSDQPLTFKQYAEKMDLLNFTKLSIGINEVASYTRTLEFSSSETKLARLLDLLSKFNAEHEFKTVLNPDGTLKEFKLNVYKEYDGENFGVGKKQKNMILLGERFLTDITRTVDYGGLFTMLVPTSTKSVVDEASKSDEHGQKVTTVTNPDGSTTRTTVWTNSDGSQSKSVITTKVTKNADGSTTTVKRTEKANGSVIETTTVRTSKGNANSTTKVLKPPTSNKDTGEKELIDIASLPDWEVKNSDGEIEFYKKGEALYAPIASKLYPSTFTAEAQSDLWIRKDSSYDAGSSEILEQMAFKDLKLHAYPSISYEIEGWTDLDIGDRVPIQDNEFSPILIIEARVSKQKLSFTKPENSRTTYDNFKSLSSNLSADIQSRLAELVEDAKPYTIQVSSDNGTTFKNGVGESVVKAKLYKGNTLTTSDVSWRWLFNDDAKISAQYTVKASDIKETSVLTVIAYVGNNEVATTEITLTNVNDGADGVDGNDGLPGKDGVGLKSTVVTYGLSTSETTQPTSWTAQVPTLTKGKYLWTKTVWTYTNNTSEIGYQKTYIAKDGNDGNDGIAGKDGVGIKSTTITYASSTSGTTKPTSGWSSSIPSVSAGNYLWTKTVWTYTDNTSETGYSVAKMGETGAKGDKGDDGAKGDKGETGNGIANTVITYGLSTSETTEPATWASNMPVLVKGMYLWTRTVQIYTNGESTTSYQKGYIAKDGAQGLPGTPGKDAQTQYTHIAYADNATGGGFSLTDNTKTYWGMYQDFSATNSNDPTKYKWSKWKGDQGLPGKPGADGKTPYIHFAYADDNKGTNLSFTDKNQQYQGYYSDYTEANSTDYKKYTWVDRLANVQIDQLNLIGAFNLTPQNATFDKTDYTLTSTTTTNTKDNVVMLQFFDAKNVVFAGFVLAEKVGKFAKSFKITKAYERFRIKINGNASDASVWCYDKDLIKLNTDYVLSGEVLSLSADGRGNGGQIKHLKIQKGKLATGFSKAPQDIDSDINSKADQTLTQEQLNALAEQDNLIKAEMEAKASIDTVDKWITAYENYVKANDADKAKSEQALKEASERILKIRYEVNDLKFVWDAIDRFMSFQNEGLVIGKKDGSAYAKFSDDRISLFSGSSEVMYISQGTLNIANGIFTKTIQIGRFRFETHPADADMLVLRYLGG